MTSNIFGFTIGHAKEKWLSGLTTLKTGTLKFSLYEAIRSSMSTP